MPETVQIVIEGVDRLSGPLRSANSALNSLRDRLSGTRNSMSSAGTAAQATAAHVSGLGTATAHANRSVGMLSIGLQGMLSVAAGIGVYRGLTDIIGGLGDAFIGFNARMEQNRIAFTTMLGSAEAAEKMLADLYDFAAKTPFEFPQIVSATRLLLAFQFEAEEVLPTMTAIGDAVSGLGGGAEQINAVVRALGQMKGAGRVMAQDMMQLTNVGIPAWDILSKAMGKSTAEVRKLSEQGLIPANKAIKDLVDGMEARFPHMMELQERTFLGLMSSLKDNVVGGLAKLGEPFFEAGRDALSKLVDALKAPDLINAIQMMANNVRFALTYVSSAFEGVGRTIEAALGSTIGQALNWGWEFIQQFAQGIMEGASFALQSAIAFVGDMLAYFFGPGSPPRVAPDIDQWGAAAMEEFLRGFTMADFGIFRSIGSVIESQLRSMVKLGLLPEEGLIPALIGRKTALAETIAGIRMGSVVTEEMLDGLVAGFGRASAAVKDYLRAELALVPATNAVRAAQNNLEAVQRRLRDLRRGGADRDTLALAQAEVDMAQDALSAARDQESIQREQVSLAKSMVDALSENQSIQAQLVSSLEKAAKGAGGVATALETLPEKAKKAAEAVKEEVKKNISEEVERLKLRIAGMFAPLEQGASRLRTILQGLFGRLGINLDNVANAMGRMVGAAGTLLGSTTALRIALGLLGLVFGALTSPIGLITAALAGAAVIWTNNLGGVQERFAELQKSIAEGDWEGAFDVIKNAAGDLLGWLGQQAGPLLSQLGKWTESFLNWAGMMAGPLLGKLGEFLGHVLGWIMDSAPIMAREFFAKWIPAAIGWVVRAAIDIIPKLLGLLLTIGNWVFEVGIPKASEFFTKMGVNIAQGLVEGIGDLAGMLGRAIGDAINGLDFWVGPFHVIGGRIEVSWPQQGGGVGRSPVYEEEVPLRDRFGALGLGRFRGLAAPPLVLAPSPAYAQPSVSSTSNVYITNLYVQDWADFERQLTIRGLQAKALSRSPGR